MARQRMLHPGFFTDADLCECSPLARLLFAGLWTVADREGRLEDRPRELKVKLLPFDDCQIEPLLAELTRVNAIQRYEVDGANYISIPNFLKYQHPHQRETPSTFPKAPTQPRKGSAQPLPSPEKAMTSRAESVTESVTESESVVSAPRKKRAVAVAETPPDPRHSPLVAKLDEVFKGKRGTAYPFDGRTAKTVQRLLQRRPRHDDALWPVELIAAWSRALDARFPDCSTLEHFERDLPKFLGTGPPSAAAPRRDEPKVYPEGKVQL